MATYFYCTEHPYERTLKHLWTEVNKSFILIHNFLETQAYFYIILILPNTFLETSHISNLTLHCELVKPMFEILVFYNDIEKYLKSGIGDIARRICL